MDNCNGFTILLINNRTGNISTNEVMMLLQRGNQHQGMEFGLLQLNFAFSKRKDIDS